MEYVNNGTSPGSRAIAQIFFAAAVLVLSFARAGQAQSSVIISDEFTWQYQPVASHSCRTYKHTLAGPGILTVRTKMSPFYSRDLGMSSEDILTHGLGYFAESLGQTINGFTEANITDFVGKPVDRISKWKVDAKQYNAEFKVCNPVKCNLAGDCAQHQAMASIVVDFASSKPVSSVSAPVSNQIQDITGAWVIVAGGTVVDRLDISANGDGYKVEARAGDGAPLLWSGFGMIEGNRLIVATRNVTNGVSGLVVMTFAGDRVHYRSYYFDGRQAWDGDYDRRR